MSSFEMVYDDIAQKIRALEGAKNVKNGHINAPYAQLILRSQKYSFN